MEPNTTEFFSAALAALPPRARQLVAFHLHRHGKELPPSWRVLVGMAGDPATAEDAAPFGRAGAWTHATLADPDAALAVLWCEAMMLSVLLQPRSEGDVRALALEHAFAVMRFGPRAR